MDISVTSRHGHQLRRQSENRRTNHPLPQFGGGEVAMSSEEDDMSEDRDLEEETEEESEDHVSEEVEEREEENESATKRESEIKLREREKKRIQTAPSGRKSR